MDKLKCCGLIEMGISYDSGIDLAKQVLQEECENHLLIYDNRTNICTLKRDVLERKKNVSIKQVPT